MKNCSISHKKCVLRPLFRSITWHDVSESEMIQFWNKKAVSAVGGGVVSDERWNWYEKLPSGRIFGSFSFDVLVIKCQLILFYGAVVESFLKSTIVIDSLDELPEWVGNSISAECKFFQIENRRNNLFSGILNLKKIECRLPIRSSFYRKASKMLAKILYIFIKL